MAFLPISNFRDPNPTFTPTNPNAVIIVRMNPLKVPNPLFGPSGAPWTTSGIAIIPIKPLPGAVRPIGYPIDSG